MLATMNPGHILALYSALGEVVYLLHQPTHYDIGYMRAFAAQHESSLLAVSRATKHFLNDPSRSGVEPRDGDLLRVSIALIDLIIGISKSGTPETLSQFADLAFTNHAHRLVYEVFPTIVPNWVVEGFSDGLPDPASLLDAEITDWRG